MTLQWILFLTTHILCTKTKHEHLKCKLWIKKILIVNLCLQFYILCTLVMYTSYYILFIDFNRRWQYYYYKTCFAFLPQSSLAKLFIVVNKNTGIYYESSLN